MCHTRNQKTIWKPKPPKVSIHNQNLRHKKLASDKASRAEIFELRVCGKKSLYFTEGDALVGALEASKLVGPCRVYKCPYCGHWHITTQLESFEESY